MSRFRVKIHFRGQSADLGHNEIRDFVTSGREAVNFYMSTGPSGRETFNLNVSAGPSGRETVNFHVSAGPSGRETVNLYVSIFRCLLGDIWTHKHAQGNAYMPLAASTAEAIIPA